MSLDFHGLLTPAYECIRQVRRNGPDDEIRASFNQAMRTAREAIEPHFANWPGDFVREVEEWFALANEYMGLSEQGRGNRSFEHSLGTKIGQFFTRAEGLNNEG